MSQHIQTHTIPSAIAGQATAAPALNARFTSLWARGDFAVHPLAFATPLIDGRAAMLAMCLAFLEARTSIWIGGWSMYARLRLVRGQDQRAGQDGAPEQYALLDRLRAAGLDSDAIALWRADGLALVDVLGLAVRRGVDVRVLLWDPLDPWNLGHLGNDPVIQAAILTDQDIQCRLDKNCRSPLHIAQGLHQKCAVVDSELAFVGGIDLTVDYGGDFDRWDVSDHPFESDLRATERGDSPHPWHDAHVMLTGAAVHDVERNLRERWDASAGRVQQRIQPLGTQLQGIQGAIASGDRPQAWAPGADEPAPPATGQDTTATTATTATTVAEQSEDAEQAGSIQIIRTIPALTYRFAPGGIYGIAQAYQQAINQAERFIYLESQYLWVEGLRLFNVTRLGWQSRKMRALVEDLALAAERGVQIALVLPDHPNVGRAVTDDTIQWLRDHAPHAVAEHRLRFYTLATSSPDAREDAMRYRPVYVHAKVAVIDDRWATVGSANLNSRGMSHDAEMNVIIAQQAFASGLRRILWAEHTGVPLPDDFTWPTGAAGSSSEAANTSTGPGTPLAVRALALTQSMPGPEGENSEPAAPEATAAETATLAASLADPERGLRALAQLADENLRRLRQGEALSGYLLPYLRASEGPAYGLHVDRRRGLLDPLREVREGVAVPHYNRYI